MTMHKINYYLNIALNEAKKSEFDVPICALIVKDDEIIAIANNRREKDNLVTSHAEILVLQEANKKLNSWRLKDCDMYVTLEPCPMCAWAIINSKIKNLYFGSYDSKYGAFGSAINLKALANSDINVFGGVEEEKCDNLLKDYFKKLRSVK